MKEGLGQGHLDRFYLTLEQRFLGDEQFVDKVGKKKKERERVRIKVKFPRLVEGERDKRSESELQRWLKMKSTIHA
jgi:hypothetical protein